MGKVKFTYRPSSTNITLHVMPQLPGRRKVRHAPQLTSSSVADWTIGWRCDTLAALAVLVIERPKCFVA